MYIELEGLKCILKFNFGCVERILNQNQGFAVI